MRTVPALLSAMLFALPPLAAPAQETPESWFEQGRAAVDRALSLRRGAGGRAKNVILFVGDGMGVATVTAARILEGQLRGESGEENMLSFEAFPNVALSKTYNTNAQVSDSAGTMSAMVTGVKTAAGLISVNQRAARGDCASQRGNHADTILEIAERRGLSTGVVSTARLTHATPAANYAHSMERNFEHDGDAGALAEPGDCADIARQLVEFRDNVPGSDGLEVALGGGRAGFLPRGVADPETGLPGARLDGRNLAAEWAASAPNSAWVWNRSQFDAVDPGATDRLLGLFAPSHMQYSLDRDDGPLGEPSLGEMTAKAIRILGRNENGFYLNVEAGRIDHAHHAANPRRALLDAIALSDAVRVALEMTDPEETLIIVTADHSHAFAIAGYSVRGNPILGKAARPDAAGRLRAERAADGLPYTTLGYLNGPVSPFSPGAGGRRPDLEGVDTEAPDFRPAALVPMPSETHAGEDVAVYAVGPGSDLVRGVMEQHVIFHVMMEALYPR